MILLYRFLVISFARYKEYTISLILFCKLSDVLHAFSCVRAIGNYLIICLGGNIFRPLLSVFYWKYSTSESIEN